MFLGGSRNSLGIRFPKKWKIAILISFTSFVLYAFAQELIRTLWIKRDQNSNGIVREAYSGNVVNASIGHECTEGNCLSVTEGTIGVATTAIKSNDPTGEDLKVRFNGGSWVSSTVSHEHHLHYAVNCSGIIQGDPVALDMAETTLNWTREERRTQMPSDEVVASWTRNCDYYRTKRKYPTQAMSQEELDFPLAFILLVHKDSAQVERLLRAVYHPQNIYCFHVDAKADQDFWTAILGLTRCFDNVFIASRLEKVQYRGFSRLQADINCMEDLVSWTGFNWKYVINLCGQDFPLKTNLEIVRQVKAYGGLNDIPGVYPTQDEWFVTRTENHHRIVNGKLQKTEIRKPPPPHDAKMYFGNAYYVASRAFVEYILNNKTAKDILYYLEDANSPDEHYWVTMSRYPGVPGGYPYSSWKSSTRFIRWTVTDEYPPCIGKYVRQVCVIGFRYLPFVTSIPHLYVNKIHYEFDPLALQCIEEMLDYRTAYPSAIADFVPDYPLTDLFPDNPPTNI